MTAPVLAPRRPGPAQLAGFGVLFAAVTAALAVLSAAPWRATPRDVAAVRIAFKHVAHVEAGLPAGPSASELAKLPRHMRPQGVAGLTRGRRADTTLRVSVDGRLLLARTYRPTGLRRDGPTFGYEELALVPGRRRLEVVLVDGDPRADSPAEATRAPGGWRLARDVEVRPGHVLLVELDAGQGLVLR